MKTKVFYILFLLLGLFTFNHAKGTHLLGGEITYKCVGNGNFVFTVTFYRDCTGISFTDNTLTVNNIGVPGITPIICTLTTPPGSTTGNAVDISPSCTASGGLNPLICSPPMTAQLGANFKGAVAKYVYVSNPVDFSNVPAVPLNQFYLFYCNVTQARNPNNNTLNCNGTGALVLRSYMYRFVDPNTQVALTPAQLCDNAPFFAENPTSLQIQDANDTTYFNNNAFDFDAGDELVYGIQNPWAADPTGTVTSLNIFPCNYSPPNSVNNPFPGVILINGNPIDTSNGLIYFTPSSNGNFLVSISVKSYRCGQLISEVSRDFQLQVVPKPTTYPADQKRPTVTAPFLVQGSSPPRYTFEGVFYAGDTVRFIMESYDFNPAFPAQQVQLYFNGINFGTNLTSLTGCPYPPCAYLEGWPDTTAVPIPINSNSGIELGRGYVGSQTAAARFTWFTACENLALNACGIRQTKFIYNVTSKDDQCPVPGRVVQPIIVDLLPSPRLQAPKIMAVKPMSNGNIELSLNSSIVDSINIQPGNANLSQSIQRQVKSFKQVEIWRADTIIGPFVKIDSISTLNFNNYVDLTANALNKNYYYFTRTISSCIDTITGISDTLGTIKIKAVFNPAASTSRISWTPYQIRNKFPSYTAGAYQIWKKVGPVGTYQPLQTVTDTFFVGPAFECGDTIFYKVSVSSATNNPNQISISDSTDIYVYDNINPAAVFMTTVNADTIAKRNVVVWRKVNAPDVTKYQIFKRTWFNGSMVGQVVGTVRQPDTTFSDPINPIDSIVYYSVCALDSCNNISVFGADLSNITTFNAVTLNKCEATLQINFSKYTGWTAGVKEYWILRSDNGSPFLPVDTIIATSNMDTTWFDSDLTNGVNYCYAVRAVSNDGITTATSNNNCAVADIIKQSTFLYVRYASVDTAKSKINLGVVIDPVADLKRFDIYRRTLDGSFVLTQSLDRASAVLSQGKTQLFFTDESSEPNKEGYDYMVVAISTCDLPADTSNIVSSVFLNGRATVLFTTELTWNNSKLLGNTPRNNIFRQIPENGLQFDFINAISGTQNNYSDNIVNIDNFEGKFCYMISNISDGSNPYALIDTVNSNIICVSQSPKLYVPNAFVADGEIVNTFAPKGTYINPSSFKMVIYNRWGEVMFETTDIKQGWNGNYKNNEAPVGVYIYSIEFKGNDDMLYKQKGSLTLLR